MDERLCDFASCFTLTNLMEASIKCYRGVDWKHQSQKFMNRRLTNCMRLFGEIVDGSYRPRPVEKFTLNERGKVREVKPVAYRDRVVQRCLIDHILLPAILRRITVENSACLKGRGLSYAYDRVRLHAENCPADGWVAQFDFSDYFHNIDKDKLLSMLGEMIGDERTMRLIETIVRDDDGGLELGSHVSQLCATMYPTDIDEAACSMPGVTGYHRYMDDGILFAESKVAAVDALRAIEAMSDDMGLKINGKKTHCNRVTHPFVFCKMRFTKTEDGVRMNVRKKQSRRSVRHARDVKMVAEANPDSEIDLQPVEASLRGYLDRGDADLSRLADGVFGKR